MRTPIPIILITVLFVLLPTSTASALTATPTVTETPTPTPVPRPYCTPPPCPPEGHFACGTSDGCPRGCGTICVLPTSEPNSIPEPITLFLFGTGLAGLAGYAAARRR